MKRVTGFWIWISSHAFIKNSFIVFMGTMSSNVLAYLYHLFVGRILGPVAYGELAALLSIFYLLNVVGEVLRTVLVKFFSIYKARGDIGESRGLFAVATLRVFWFDIAGLILAFAVSRPVAGFLHIDSNFTIIWIYLSLALFLLTIINASLLQAYQHFKAVMLLTNIGMAMRVIFGTISAFFGVTATVFSGAVANLIGYFLYLVPLRFLWQAREKIPSITMGDTLKYSAPTFLTTLSMTALFSQDVLLVKHFFPAADAGIYSGLSVLGKVIFFASSSIGFVLFPTIAERLELKKPFMHLVGLALLLVGGVSGGLTGFYFLFPDIVIRLLLGSAFIGASSYLGLFGMFISFYALVNLLVTVCLSAGRVRVWLFTAVGALLQTILINYYHTDLKLVIVINTCLVGGVACGLFVYLFKGEYAKTKA